MIETALINYSLNINTKIVEKKKPGRKLKSTQLQSNTQQHTAIQAENQVLDKATDLKIIDFIFCNIQ